MSVQLNCTICLEPLQENDPIHIPHTDGTPENRRHIGDGIHQGCLRNWVLARYTEDRPILCPLGCSDKLISPQLVLSGEELQGRMAKRLVNRLSNWICERLEPPINRQILLCTSMAGAATAAIGQIATNGMSLLVRSVAGQWIPSSVVFVSGTGLSFVVGTALGSVAAHALSGQGAMGLEMRGIHGLSVITAAVSSIFGMAAAQALLN